MSYTKQTWNTGDVITAEKLNHMEDGIERGYDLVLIYDGSGATPAMTGYGLSVEELVEKIESIEEVTVKCSNVADSENGSMRHSFISNAYNYDSDKLTQPETFSLSFSNGGKSFGIYSYTDQPTQFCVEDSYFYYTYNSETKQYTFTYNGE